MTDYILGPVPTFTADINAGRADGRPLWHCAHTLAPTSPFARTGLPCTFTAPYGSPEQIRHAATGHPLTPAERKRREDEAAKRQAQANTEVLCMICDRRWPPGSQHLCSPTSGAPLPHEQIVAKARSNALKAELEALKRD